MNYGLVSKFTKNNSLVDFFFQSTAVDCLNSFIDFNFFVPDIDIVNKDINGIACGTYGDPPTMDGMQLYNAIIVIEDWKVKCVCKPGQELFKMVSTYYCIGMISKTYVLRPIHFQTFYCKKS